MTPDIPLVVATVASAAAGFVNSIAGGGGLVSIPILLGLFPAAPPAALFGTNKAAMVCGTLQAAGSYGRHVRLPWGMLGPAIWAALVGGLAGAGLVTVVSSDWLRPLLPVMLGLVLVHTVLHHEAGRVHAPWLAPRAEAAAGTAIAGGLGLYDGFFGPGTGSFFIHLFVRLLGFNFLHAVAAAKILNAATNLGALVTFAWTGNVWWSLALPMAVANIAGSWAGSRLAIRHGAAFVRTVFVVVVAALVLKTAYDVYLAPPAGHASGKASAFSRDELGPCDSRGVVGTAWGIGGTLTPALSRRERDRGSVTGDDAPPHNVPTMARSRYRASAPVPQQSSATASLRQSGLACATFAIIGLPEDGPAHAVSSVVLPCALPTPGNVLLVDQSWTGLPPRQATNTRHGSPTPSSANQVA